MREGYLLVHCTGWDVVVEGEAEDGCQSQLIEITMGEMDHGWWGGDVAALAPRCKLLYQKRKMGNVTNIAPLPASAGTLRRTSPPPT